jgi:hypothetical protein
MCGKYSYTVNLATVSICMDTHAAFTRIWFSIFVNSGGIPLVGIPHTGIPGRFTSMNGGGIPRLRIPHAGISHPATLSAEACVGLNVQCPLLQIFYENRNLSVNSSRIPKY